MKKKVVTSVAVIIALSAFCFVGTGFQKRENVVLGDYSVSEDGTTILLGVQVASSMGYVRGYKDNGGGVKPRYLTFYSAFGGFNSTFGSVNAIILEVEPNDTEIYFNRPENGYELVLVKDEESGEWTRPVD